MEPKIEPIEQGFLPNYINYVLPPTPSGSSTDTAPSPPRSEHVEQKMHFYSDYYNTQENNLHLMDTEQLYKETTQQHINDCEHNQTQYEPNHLMLSNPWPDQATNLSTEQPLLLTPSPNNSSDDQHQQTNKRRRRRTQYTSFQILELENAYQNARYLTTVQKMELSKKLQLEPQRIKVWYQNRRMKDKKVGIKTKRKVKNKMEQEEAILSSEIPRTLENVEIKLEPEPCSTSPSVKTRLLNHSVLAKGYRSPVSPALADYRPRIPSPYHWNGIPYSPSVFNGGYHVPNTYFNQYQGQQYNVAEFFNPHSSYQYNIPVLPSNVREQDKFNDENGLNSREDAINFAIAQEFLTKSIQF